MFSLRCFMLFLWLDPVTSSMNRIFVDTTLPDSAFPVLRRDVSRLKTNIMAEFTGTFYTLCVLHCAERRFCTAINYKDSTEGNEPNCQLTNTTEHKFDETASEKEKTWTFRKIDIDRTPMTTCKEETNECQNGGTMIWDPVKSFTCLCKEGYGGELCEKDNNEHTGRTWKGPLGESVILANEPVSFTNNLTEWLAQTGIGNWSICWRATRDGWAASKFHSNCDGIKPTLTIVQVAATFVFGGYATESWNATNGPTPAQGSFLFSLRNNDDLGPFIAPLIQWNEQRAMFCQIGFGPCFDRDWCIHDNAGLNKESKADFGHIYQLPSGYTPGEPKTKSLLAGSEYFTPSEIEVLYLN